MLVFDLRSLLFGLVVLLITTAVASTVITWGLATRARWRRTLEELTPLLESTPLGILLFTGANRLIYINPAASRLLAIPRHAAALPDALWTIVQAQAWGAGAGDDERETTASTWRKLRTPALEGGAQITLEWWFAAVQTVRITAVRDVTAQLVSAQEARLLLSSLSHELRTPLATISTHIEVLRIPTLPAEVQAQSLQFMSDETQRLVRLVANAMELGRLDSGIEQDLQAVNLLEVVDDAVAQMTPSAQQVGATIVTAVQASHLMVLGQPDRLKQVFLNLLDNAIKYGVSKEGASKEGADDQTIVVTLTPVAGGVHCSVQDHGAGIPPEHVPLLTQRFYRAAPAGIPGSGLGLAIVSAILRQHGSHLQIQSNFSAEQSGAEDETHGTSASFTLPTAGRSHHP
jgi:two-component system phosphate regulon sensor histidine kinase PhoR